MSAQIGAVIAGYSSPCRFVRESIVVS